MFVFVYQVAYSHDGEHKPVNEGQAVAIALDTAKQFVDFDPGLDFGTLDASWKNATMKDAKMHKKGNGYFIIGILNRDENRTLYVLVSIMGEVYDANFSGDFEGLN